MLRLVINDEEYFNDETNEFIVSEPTILKLEHSLLSVSRWEQKFEKPFLAPGDKTKEETLAYIEAMILDEDHPEDIVSKLTHDHLTQINDYIDAPSTATTFSETKQRPTSKNQVITSELVYYWMVTQTIPFECEKWHLNRLFALLRICSVKNTKQPKMSKNELAARQRALNEERKARLNTTG